MTEHEIKVWLRSPEWNQGLFLLSKYSQHPSIRQAIIMMGESRVSKAKMVSTLQAILDLATPTEAPAPEKTIARLTERVFLLEAILAQVTIEVEKIIQVMDKGKSNDTIQNIQ